MIERLRIAFTTELGAIFLLLVALLVVLGLIYALLLFRQRKKDRLKYLYNAYYEEAEKILESYSFEKNAVADFFGRESIVASTSGEKFLCIIPPPYKYSQEAKSRFEEYIRAIGTTSRTLLSHYSLTATEKCWITMQEGLLHADGRKLLSIDKWVKDGRLTSAMVEQILVDIARTLAKLHLCHSERGNRLYHGFLLPRSLFVESDASGGIEKVVIANHGFAYAIGAKEMQHHFDELAAGKMCVDRFAADSLLNQISMLAPEQRERKAVDSVGPSCDFYSYAMVALYLFTGKKYSSPAEVDWNSIGEKWRHFLRSSLSNEVDKRPKSFDDLEVWLRDPEFSLTLKRENISINTLYESGSASGEGEESLQLDAIRELTKRRGEEKEDLAFDKLFNEGNAAFKNQCWEEAKSCYLKALELQERHPRLRLNLAIAHYELGEVESAERELEVVVSIDPKMAAEFRKHIAFSSL